MNKNVLVYGLGKSGIGAGKLVENHGGNLRFYDSNNGLIREKIQEEFQKEVLIYLGEFPREIIGELDMAILSPGVPTDLPEILEMKEKGVEIIGEIELAYRCGQGKILAITGTNGKTTTTTLLGEIVERYTKNFFVVGNIGNPYTLVADQTTKDSIIVAEISSFQLETIDRFRPQVSAILNITPDHLNRHHTMEAYVDAKVSITKNQDGQEFCVLNKEDPYTQEIEKRIPAKKLYFSSKRVLDQGMYLKDKKIICKMDEDIKVLCNTADLHILGDHNMENVMAASLIAIAAGIPFDIIKESVLSFKGVAHRIEYIKEVKGVKYYNDSKGTNPDAAIKGIQAMERRTVLIGGGYDKDSSYTEWIESFDGKVKMLILIGDTKEKIAQTAKKAGFLDYTLVDTFEEAVLLASEIANPGEAVLLSPACASWGMFPNYEVRGDKFKEIVNSIS